MNQDQQLVLRLFTHAEDRILAQWVDTIAGPARAGGEAGRRRIDAEATEVLHAVQAGLRAGAAPELFDAAAWGELRDQLASLSQSRAAQGQSAGDTSWFVLGLKRPLFAAVQQEVPGAQQQMETLWRVSALVDQMAQWTVSTYQQSREAIVRRQQDELLELSTPVIQLFDQVLAVPMIGTLDSSRTQIVMETLLQRIVETGSRFAIIDITGVPTVDTLVAQHLLKTVSATRLMGAECIISGIRPQIAQTIVQLGIDLQGVATKATLADALQLALTRMGYGLQRTRK